MNIVENDFFYRSIETEFFICNTTKADIHPVEFLNCNLKIFVGCYYMDISQLLVEQNLPFVVSSNKGNMLDFYTL